MCVQSQPFIDALSSLVHPRDGHTRIFAMLEGYFDESGIHDGADVCVVAGYFADQDRWKKFEPQWRAANDREDIPEFHAKEFFGPHPPGNRYHGWTDGRCRHYLNRLLRVINDCSLSPVGSAVVIADWKALRIEQRRYFTGGEWHPTKLKFLSSGCPSKPYYVPFQECISRVAKHCQKEEIAHFSFDLNNQFSGYAKNLYALMKGYPLPYKDHLGVLSLPTSIEAVQLQAADLLCFLFKEHIPKRLRNPRCPIHPILGRAIGHARMREDFPLYNGAEFKRQLEVLDPRPHWSL
jgi:Protein of unknown function (DUF3800)